MMLLFHHIPPFSSVLVALVMFCAIWSFNLVSPLEAWSFVLYSAKTDVVFCEMRIPPVLTTDQALYLCISSLHAYCLTSRGPFSFYFCLFSSCLYLYCLLCTCSLAVCVLVIVGLNSKQENKRYRFSFASLSCIQFCKLDADSISYKKLAFGFNSDNSFVSDTEHN